MRKRLRYLWHQSDPASLEVLAALVVLWLGAALLFPSTNRLDLPLHVFGVLALPAGAMALVGVLWPWKWLRTIGILGVIVFMTALATVLAISIHGFAWGGYVVIAGAEWWALWRLWYDR